MTILVDSRQQAGKHDLKHQQLTDLGAKLMVSKLPIGDYTRLDNMSVVVDTKKDICELMGNLGKDHKRFSAECQRAQDNGIKLIILVEEMPPNGTIANWKSPVWKSTTKQHKKGEKICKMSPSGASRMIFTMRMKYGVQVMYCEPNCTGKKIYELLGGDADGL